MTKQLDIRNVDRMAPLIAVLLDIDRPGEWALFVSWPPAHAGDVAGFQVFATTHDTGMPRLKD